MNKKPFFFRVSLNDEIFFARNLSLLLKSGITLVEALTILKEGTKSRSLKYIIEKIAIDIERGQFLSNALAKFSPPLDNFFISVIKVGELTGRLPENCDKIAEELRKIQRLRNKVISALIYPAFIIGVMIIVIFLVVYFLFPKLLQIFEDLKIELPLITKIFLKIATFLLNYGYWLIIFFILILVLFIFLLRNKKIKFYFDKFVVNFPLTFSIFKKYTLANLSRNLAILLEGGIPIIEALKITSASLSNVFYQKKIEEAANFVASGHSFEEFLIKYPNYFPYNFVKMISIGEKTGNLINTLFYLAENFEKELDIDLERLVNLMEPLILFVLAVIVTFIALSIVIPIYELSDKLKK